MKMQSDADRKAEVLDRLVKTLRKAAAFDELVKTLKSIRVSGAWIDRPDAAREAAATIVKAFLQLLHDGSAPVQSQQPVVELLGALAGIKEGHATWLTKGIKSSTGAEDMGRLSVLAEACAAVDALYLGGKTIEDALRQVAGLVRPFLPPGGRRATDFAFLRQWRKELRGDRKPRAARDLYDQILKDLKTNFVADAREQGWPRAANFKRAYYRKRAHRLLGDLRQRAARLALAPPKSDP
jgi:hypothetical protein